MNRKNISMAAVAGLSALLLSSCMKEDANPALGTTGDVMALYNLRQFYQGSEVTLGANTLNGSSKITGVVISNTTDGNTDANTVVIQQNGATTQTVSELIRGVVLRMNTAPGYSVGDSIQVDVTGTKLGRVNGRMTISGVSADKITVLATGKTPYLRYVTQGMLHENMDQYENTLVALTADVVDYTAGGTLGGLQKLNDNTGAPVYVKTMSSASFANTALPMNAQFTGIAAYHRESGNDTAGATKVIMPRNAADIQFASGTIYAGFPESFETPDAATKASYNSGTNIITASTGNWYLLQAILGNTLGSDRINLPGKQAIRMQQNLTTSGYLQMNFDVPNASKVTVFYGRYATDAKSTFRLEASTNGGTTWTAVGANINDMPDRGMKQATWLVNYTVPVRFRINKLGTGTSNNGRLNLDDFTIYKK